MFRRPTPSSAPLLLSMRHSRPEFRSPALFCWPETHQASVPRSRPLMNDQTDGNGPKQTAPTQHKLAQSSEHRQERDGWPSEASSNCIHWPRQKTVQVAINPTFEEHRLIVISHSLPQRADGELRLSIISQRKKSRLEGAASRSRSEANTRRKTATCAGTAV